MKNIYLFLIFYILATKMFCQGGNTCAQALANPLSIGTTVTKSTCNEGNDFSTPNSCLGGNPINALDYLYAITPTSSGMIDVNLTANITTSFPITVMYSIVVIYQGCPTLNNCITSVLTIIYASPTTSFSTSFEALAGVTYFISVDGWNPGPNFANCYTFTLTTVQTPILVNSGCSNDGFSSGLSGWYGTLGRAYTNVIGQPIPYYISESSLIGLPRVTTGSSFIDPCLPFTVNSPLGGTFVRLGRRPTPPASAAREAQRISYRFTVTPSSTLFTYAFLPVLQEPGHFPQEQPFFEAIMILQNGSVLPCSRYIVAAGQGLSGYLNSSICAGTIYRNWGTVSIDLSNYIGQTVTMQFTTGGCSQSAHWGYTYIDYRCEQSPLYIQPQNMQICPGDQISLSAPSGYQTYQWLPFGLNTQNININPTIGSVITLNITSFNGCISSYQYIIGALPCCSNSNLQIYEN